jgi:hypothetical protein
MSPKKARIIGNANIQVWILLKFPPIYLKKGSGERESAFLPAKSDKKADCIDKANRGLTPFA